MYSIQTNKNFIIIIFIIAIIETILLLKDIYLEIKYQKKLKLKNTNPFLKNNIILLLGLYGCAFSIKYNIQKDIFLINYMSVIAVIFYCICIMKIFTILTHNSDTKKLRYKNTMKKSKYAKHMKIKKTRKGNIVEFK